MDSKFKVGDTVYFVCLWPKPHIASLKLFSVGKHYSEVVIPARKGFIQWVKKVSNKKIASTPEKVFEQFKDDQLQKLEKRVTREMNSYVNKKKELENMEMLEIKN